MLRQQTVVGVRPLARRTAVDRLGDRMVRAPVALARARLTGSFQQSIITQLALAMMLTVLAMVLYLQQASQISVHEFNIADLQRQQTHLSLTNINLATQMSQLQSVPRITAIATSQLHMGKPDTGAALWISQAIPMVAPPPPTGSDSSVAVHNSQPLHWMTSTLTWIKSQL